MYQAIGDSEQALSHYEKAVAVARASKNTAQVANTLDQIAWLKADRGSYDEALSLAEEVLALYVGADDGFGLAHVYNTLASIEHDLGDLGAAQSWHEKALALRTEENDLMGMAASFNNLGSLFLDMGDYARAIESLLKALEIGEPLGYMDVLTVTTGNLAHAYAHEGDLARALEFARRGLATAEEKQVPPRIGMQNAVVVAKIQLGIDDWETGHFAEGIVELKAAQLIYYAIDDWEGYQAYVKIDGTKEWTTTWNHGGSAYNLCGQYSSGYFDTTFSVDRTASHIAPSLTLAVGAGPFTDNDGVNYNSFGFDNLYVWVR